MIQPPILPLVSAQDAGNSQLAQKEVADTGSVVGVPDVNVGQLMVADGEGPALESVEDLAKRAGTNIEESRLAKMTVDEDRAIDVAVTVFADDPDAGSGGFRCIEQGCTRGVE